MISVQKVVFIHSDGLGISPDRPLDEKWAGQNIQAVFLKGLKIPEADLGRIGDFLELDRPELSFPPEFLSEGCHF